MYRYLSIRSDSKYKYIKSSELEAYFGSCKEELRKNGRLNYENSEIFPWMQLAIVFGDSDGNYSSKNPNSITRVNQTELVCEHDGSDACYKPYLTICKKGGKQV